jgi:hypothetical protein
MCYVKQVAVMTLILLSPALTAGAQEAPTFARDVAPILYKNCADCHRPDGGAPFNFLSEVDPVRRHRLIAHVTERKIMPPWMVTASDYEFANYRGLTDEEIQVLQDWSAAGAPLGDLNELPEAPVYPAEWHIGTPDVIIQEEEPYEVPVEGPDVYRSSVVRLPPTPDGKYICAIEYLPNAKGTTHHCLIYVDPSGEARAFLEQNPGNDYDIPMYLNRDRIEAWAVGQVMFRWPDGIRRSFPEGVDLVLQTHYHPIGKPETSQARLGIYYDESPPTRHYINFDVPFLFGQSSNMLIPAGAKHYTLHDEFEVKGEALLGIIYPHAHFLCTGMESVLVFPDGTEKLLLRLDEWDFDWQERYILKEPILIPAGAKFKNQFWYDNSADNPFNPNDPPKDVFWGTDSTDEMAAFTYAFATESLEELDKIAAGLGEKTRRDIENADEYILARSLWERDVVPRLDKDGNGVVSEMEILTAAHQFVAGQVVGTGSRGSAQDNPAPGKRRASYLGAITDDFGIGGEMAKKLSRAMPKYVVMEYSGLLAGIGFALLAILIAFIFLLRKIYRILRPARL